MRNVISPLGFALIWLLLGPTAAFGGGSAEKNQKTSFHFGTPCSITLYGRASDSFFASLFARMDELDGQLSSHNDLSAVSTLNRAAGEGACLAEVAPRAAVTNSIHKLARALCQSFGQSDADNRDGRMPIGQTASLDATLSQAGAL